MNPSNCKLIAGVTNIFISICFFLPYFTAGFEGWSVSVSGWNMAAGIEVLGDNYGGESSNFLYLILPAAVMFVLLLPKSNKWPFLVAAILNGLNMFILAEIFTMITDDIDLKAGVGLALALIGAIGSMICMVIGFVAAVRIGIKVKPVLAVMDKLTKEPAMETVFCSECGAKGSGEDMFCSECGTKHTI